MRHEEYLLQCDCVAWFRLQYSHHLIYHIPNGERRDAVTGARLKRAGVVAGIPDLCIPYANGEHTHLYIEMKNGKSGRLSPAQKAIHAELEKGGAMVAVVHDFPEFVRVVTDYMNAARD